LLYFLLYAFARQGPQIHVPLGYASGFYKASDSSIGYTDFLLTLFFRINTIESAVEIVRCNGYWDAGQNQTVLSYAC